MTQFRTFSVLLMLHVLSTSGCATVYRAITNADDISVKQKERRANAVKDYDTRRDRAQVHAAQARWREGNTAACREALDQVLVRNPGYLPARLLLAEVLLSEEKYDRAELLLSDMLVEQPNDAQLHFLSGLANDGLGRRDEAFKSYQRAAQIDPQSEQYAQFCQSVMVSDRKPTRLASHTESVRSDSGVATASDIESIADDSPQVSQALNDAQRALAASELRAAKTHLGRAATLEPDSPVGAVRAAVLALRYGQSEMAIGLLQPRQAEFPESAVLFRTLGTAYFQQADYRLAQKALETAVSLDNSNALAYFLMGNTLEKLGHTTAAAGHFETARRLGSEHLHDVQR